ARRPLRHSYGEPSTPMCPRRSGVGPGPRGRAMTADLPIPPPRSGRPQPSAEPAVPVFFISDSTGISAETMGNALLLQFPSVPFERRLIPFVRTVEEAREVRADLDAA